VLLERIYDDHHWCRSYTSTLEGDVGGTGAAVLPESAMSRCMGGMLVYQTWRCKNMMRYRLLRSTTLVLLPLFCLLWWVVPATATTLSIADAVIDPDRSRVPEGKLTIAVHVSLSPKWLNPQDSPGAMALEMLWKVHDNMIKAMRGNVYTYSLAEFYEMSPDFKVATVRLREGLKFHNGDPVTSEDVKFSYDNYHGINATFLHDKTERVEVVDNRTVQFHFKEPFLDFLMYYGTPASAAGVIIPKN